MRSDMALKTFSMNAPISRNAWRSFFSMGEPQGMKQPWLSGLPSFSTR